MFNSITIPAMLTGFVQSVVDKATIVTRAYRSFVANILSIKGQMAASTEKHVCPLCGTVMHQHGTTSITLVHTPVMHVFADRTEIEVERARYCCPSCGCTKQQPIPFKAQDHCITTALERYVCLLMERSFTLKQASQITGLNPKTIKEIDKKRLNNLYTVNGEGKVLKKPERYSRYLAIDEFKLHDGNKYATHIMDLETGEVLWVLPGKTKKIVYDFIEHVGLEWMSHVVCLACDMNADFASAFKEKCPHIDIVFDRFHIVKHFNEDVIAKVRKDEQKRLIDEGRKEEAARLKRSKYILGKKKENLQKADEKAGTVRRKGSELFNFPETQRYGGQEARLRGILADNELLLATDVVKEALSEAYNPMVTEEGMPPRRKTMKEMQWEIEVIIIMCDETKNEHFKKFGRLLKNHIDGIVTFAKYNLSSGKIEGFNNKIKTIRRAGYGYPDDEYFFLKIMDASRHGHAQK